MQLRKLIEKVRCWLPNSLLTGVAMLLTYSLIVQLSYARVNQTQMAAPQASPLSSPSPAPKPLASDNPWKDYFDAVSKEREFVQADAKANLERVERLQDRIFALIVGLGLLLLGFVYFLFGQTRKEVLAQLKDEISDIVRQDIRRNVRIQVEAYYKNRPILWVHPEADTTGEVAIRALQKMGFSNLEELALKDGQQLHELPDADVIIFTYDDSFRRTPLTASNQQPSPPQEPEARRQLNMLVKLMPQSRQIPLLIRTRDNKSIGQEEEEILRGLIHVPANFDSTLLTQSLTLIHR